MQKVTPHLWFDREALEAAEFYISVFKDSMQNSVSKLQGTPSGTVILFPLISWARSSPSSVQGPFFKFNPSISFLVACREKSNVDILWEKLSEGGSALKELGEYPFSERYG